MHQASALNPDKQVNAEPLELQLYTSQSMMYTRNGLILNQLRYHVLSNTITSIITNSDQNSDQTNSDQNSDYYLKICMILACIFKHSHFVCGQMYWNLTKRNPPVHQLNIWNTNLIHKKSHDMI